MNDRVDNKWRHNNDNNCNTQRKQVLQMYSTRLQVYLSSNSLERQKAKQNASHGTCVSAHYCPVTLGLTYCHQSTQRRGKGKRYPAFFFSFSHSHTSSVTNKRRNNSTTIQNAYWVQVWKRKQFQQMEDQWWRISTLITSSSFCLSFCPTDYVTNKNRQWTRASTAPLAFGGRWWGAHATVSGAREGRECSRRVTR